MTARADADLREMYAVGACRAPRCGRCSIRWIPTAKAHPRTGHKVGSGAPIPLDAGRDPNGPIVLDRDPTSGAWTARPLDQADDPGRPRYAVHWTSCHTPALYRRVRDKADPHGLFPTLPVRAAAGVAEWNCPGCNEPHPAVLGALCLECGRAAVARWGPDMRPTIASWTDDFRRLLVLEPFDLDG